MKKEDWLIPEGVPHYSNDTHIEIGGYMGPRRSGYQFWHGEYGKHPLDPPEGWKSYITEKDFQDYLDAGFTFVLSEGDAWYDYNNEKGKFVEDFIESDLYPYMELAEKVGLPVVPAAQWLVDFASSADPQLSNYKKNKLKKMVDDLSKYKMFKGLTLHDEPYIPQVPVAGEIHRYLKSIKPDIYLYTCMLPIYGRNSMFTNEITDDKEEAYKHYVDKVMEETGTFTYDHYPLYIDNRDPKNRKTRIQSDYYWNYELVAGEAKKMNCDTGMVVQSAAWGPLGEEEEGCHPRRVLSKADVSFQVYSALAYGMKSISYYTYWTHYTQAEYLCYYSAMVEYPRKVDGTPDVNGEAVKTPTYYAVQEVNREIQKFDHVLMRYKWQGTTAVVPEGKKISEVLSYVREYHSPRIHSVMATEETIIGCLKDEKGYDGFVVVNATDPGIRKNDKVTIRFKEAASAICFIEGQEQMLDLQNGTFSYELASGQGIFIIPIK